MKDLALTRSRRNVPMFSVGITYSTNFKVQGRDIGYSLAYDYDNKTIQQMTAISTQYTVRTITNVLMRRLNF
jgi:hypothetical protein